MWFWGTADAAPMPDLQFMACLVLHRWGFPGAGGSFVGSMDVTKPYKFIGFGAMDVTKPYEFIWLGAMDVTTSIN